MLLMQAALAAADAQTMQAVPNMLEIVPRGVNKVRVPRCMSHSRYLLSGCTHVKGLDPAQCG